ncbi:lysophospholipid acyltransferase family protein [Candidatus Pelagibacter communis]|uniref:Lipid A biosynthesis lauroyl acyltransferase n=2 Tax=Pelagibacter ubique TaxID=198252 RepID=Q4FPB6_PELUB|nr:lysophospholipid acyltransferase family protein [Candidatus Pelagibacter ubique]AAZ20973.1 lipid A biosynthesis lauroyl acyltransferase [Candidatus Pelagibacter ubique HTCC1062]EAS85172.1 lipid A biosynthesis lauroyl acyltransferase [Candidatus Pelagibacter ubique HTCC1002]
MKKIKYFFEFLIISSLFIIYKFLGLKISSHFSGKLFETFGPIFRSKNLIKTNIQRAIPKINTSKIKSITKDMWNNYGRTLSEYMFLKGFRNDQFRSNINITGKEILQKIKFEKTPVIFVSGHFSNFELMAMEIEKSGVNLSAIYRPLNNIFLNILMERIRKKYICKNQIKKGTSGVRELLKLYKKGYSIALMIDQRVSQGIKSKFFNQEAFTTTIPAQFIKKFNCKVVPISIKRHNGVNFNIKVEKPIEFSKNSSTEKITRELNIWLEKTILKNPGEWIWSHDRWK